MVQREVFEPKTGELRYAQASGEAQVQHRAAGRRRIDIFRERTRTNMARVQVGDGLNEIRQRAVEPIELPHTKTSP
jgi:hypothetical protein